MMLSQTSRFVSNFDKLLELWDINSDVNPISATTSGDALNAVDVGATTSKSVVAIFHFEDYGNYTAGTAEWHGILEVSDAPGGTWKEVAKTVLVPGNIGKSEISFSGVQLNNLLGKFGYHADSVYLRATFAKTGTPDDLTAGSYLGAY